MVDHLLALKKLISEYFRQHPQNARKLTLHEWTVTNEVCSLLDDVSEATIRMQGAGDTYVSQAMFIMTEVIAILIEGSNLTRVPERHRLATPTRQHPHRIGPGRGAYLGGARRAGSTAGGDGRQKLPVELAPNLLLKLYCSSTVCLKLVVVYKILDILSLLSGKEYKYTTVDVLYQFSLDISSPRTCSI